MRTCLIELSGRPVFRRCVPVYYHSLSRPTLSFSQIPMTRPTPSGSCYTRSTIIRSEKNIPTLPNWAGTPRASDAVYESCRFTLFGLPGHAGRTPVEPLRFGRHAPRVSPFSIFVILCNQSRFFFLRPRFIARYCDSAWIVGLEALMLSTAFLFELLLPESVPGTSCFRDIRSFGEVLVQLPAEPNTISRDLFLSARKTLAAVMFPSV